MAAVSRCAPGYRSRYFQACVFLIGPEHCAAYMESEAAPLPLSDRLWTWFESNKKQALYGAVVLVAAGIIGGFVYWRQNEKELAADEALSNVSAPNTPNAGARPGAPEAFLKVAATYPNSSAALRAVLLAATSYFLEGKYQEAKMQFDKF